jgi:predicted dehydrogenase
MDKGNLSRRGFLRALVTAFMASGSACSRRRSYQQPPLFPEWYARELAVVEAAKAERAKQTLPAYDRLPIGLVGVGGRGNYLLERRLRGRADVQVVAVCDVDAERCADAAAAVSKDCARYRDYRDLAAHKDLAAVFVATPDHWHALVTLEALRAGKDVYCEKPLSLTIAEGQAVLRAARAPGRVVQVGSHQRSDDLQFRFACELVRNGRLGKLRQIHTLVGKNPEGGPFPEQAVPAGLDWDFWLGPTPKVPYVEERCHYQFRWWYEYSGGRMTDWGAHHNDIAQWALGMDDNGPVAVTGSGAEPSGFPNSFNCHPHFHVTYTYANGVELHCTSESNGIRFTGEDGRWIFVCREPNKCSASDPRLLDEPLPRDATRLELSTDHVGNFFDCVRSRGRPICDVEVGHRTASVCHLGVIALRLHRALRWDPVGEAFVGDDEANAWRGREMRAPWKLEG